MVQTRSNPGIKSIARNIINGTPAPSIDTGDVAYRILIPATKLLEDPQLAPLIQGDILSDTL